MLQTTTSSVSMSRASSRAPARLMVAVHADAKAAVSATQQASEEAKIKHVLEVLEREHTRHNHGRSLVISYAGAGRRASVGCEEEHPGNMSGLPVEPNYYDRYTMSE
ncbi:hypothetical protein FOA52_010399 [Chlamydomonas sp. UWO 241]|nr:hypothetical protein FOA52_010399 [Chlamydomonas sp. UWO 241]